MVDLRVTTTTGAHAMLEEAAVEGFQSSLRGEMLCPGDEGYDEARKVWNGMVDKKPAIIARCAGVADVINSVNLPAPTICWCRSVVAATTSLATLCAMAGS